MKTITRGRRRKATPPPTAKELWQTAVEEVERHRPAGMTREAAEAIVDGELAAIDREQSARRP